MKYNNTHKISETNFDEWLRSTGFLPPMNEIELLRLDELLNEFDFKLKDTVIDPLEIIAGAACAISYTPIVILKEDLQQEIDVLKMAARKGNTSIPQHIIDKMQQKHKKSDNEK